MTREEARKILEVMRVFALSADEDRLDLTSDEIIDALAVAIEALEENPFKVVYDFFSEYVFPCNDDLVDSPNDYYTGIFDLMARIKEKADDIDASALGGNNIYEK